MERAKTNKKKTQPHPKEQRDFSFGQSLLCLKQTTRTSVLEQQMHNKLEKSERESSPSKTAWHQSLLKLSL